MSHGTACLPRLDVDVKLLRRRRRGSRAITACYPCRRRKIKCTRTRPCDGCIRGSHIDLCEYHTEIPPGPSESTSNRATLSNQETPEKEKTVTEPVQGLFLDPIQPYHSKVHLGLESLPNLLSNAKYFAVSSFVTRQDAQTIFELLCLQDSSYTFPFTNLWSPHDDLAAVYSVLPGDETILE